MADYHENVLRGVAYGSSNRFSTFESFEPLTVDEFRSISENADAGALEDIQLLRMWIKPVQRWLQQHFRIDQRGYSTGTIPSLESLTEDFKVATAICVDHFFKNRDEVIGQETVNGAGSRNWSNAIPARAQQLLERYRHDGGRVGRA